MADSKRDWIADCEHKAQHVLARQLASQAELDAVRPKSRSSPLKEWIRYYVALGGFLYRGQLRASVLEHAEADAEVARSLREEPLRVTLTHPAGAEVLAYMKSFDALAWFFAVRDDLLAFLVDRREALRQQERVEFLPLIEETNVEISYQLRLLCWAACTEGVGVPFPFEDARPEIPEPFASLLPVDLLRIHDAFLRVNVGGLQAADKLVAPQKAAGNAQRPSWSVFIGQMELRTHRPAKRLMKNEALAPKLLAVKLTAPPDEPEEKRLPKGEAA